MPPLDLDHESWPIVAGWDDPLAPRGGYRLSSLKASVDHEGAPALEWEEAKNPERALVTGDPTWRDYSLQCRVQALQRETKPNADNFTISEAMAGIIFRVETSRKYYYFCVQGKRRFVLYRRMDNEWFELAAQEFSYDEEILTLRVSLDGDGIRAECPEHGITFFATDTLIPTGRAGFRAWGKCRLFDLEVTMTPSQQRTQQRLAEALAARTAHLSSSVPDAVEAGVLNFEEGRGPRLCNCFCNPERNDFLLAHDKGLIATTWQGDELWRLPEQASHVGMAADADADGSRRLYGLVGERQRAEQVNVAGHTSATIVPDEMIVIHGATGQVLARAKLPEEAEVENLRQLDLSFETGRLVSDKAHDVIVREWRTDKGGGGIHLWAYDADLNRLWHHQVNPPYGHHNAVHFYDVNGDGRDEVLAGGTLLSARGEVIWVHDRAEEMARISGAGHYDAALIGHFAEDHETDPVAFLIAGSAGVYVVDGLTGRTRAVHRLGHAQWGMTCKVREDIPGTQVMAGTRWGNMGILSLFSGRGERLWAIQPDYILQGACPVQWLEEGPQHIWHNTSRDAFGLYDGHGRLVQPLRNVRKAWGDKATRFEAQCRMLQRTPGGPPTLAVNVDGRLHLFERA